MATIGNVNRARRASTATPVAVLHATTTTRHVIQVSQLMARREQPASFDFGDDYAAALRDQLAALKQVQAQQIAKMMADAKKNLEEGATFLAENAKKEGVKTTASGLQYEVLTEGKGDKPTAEDRVTVHYKGTLINGEEFDSSISRGQPVTFPLGNVIEGWTEGVQLMKPGGKARLTCPPAIAYGERGAGGVIPPNATLQFEIELLSVRR